MKNTVRHRLIDNCNIDLGNGSSLVILDYIRKPTWNGEHIGTLSPENIKLCIKKTYLISIEGQDYTIMMSRTNDGYPCIVDELANIFGFRKCGSNTVNYGKFRYVIYNIDDLNPITIKSLTPKDITQEFKILVQDMLVFRLIMGVTNNNDSSLLLIDNNPVSINNNRPKDSLTRSFPIISNAVINRWFIDDYKASLNRILCGRDLSEIRQEIQLVINRINCDLIFLENDIVGRILSIID